VLYKKHWKSIFIINIAMGIETMLWDYYGYVKERQIWRWL